MDPYNATMRTLHECHYVHIRNNQIVPVLSALEVPHYYNAECWLTDQKYAAIFSEMFLQSDERSLQGVGLVTKMTDNSSARANREFNL